MSASPIVEIDYPTSDGKPFAETDLHRKLMIEVIELLDGFFANRADVYVSGNMLVLYEEGNPRKHRAPDVFVVWGVPKHERENYKIWEEGKAPGVVFEITSKTTKKRDIRDKFRIYRDIWKVNEYFLFDPREDYLEPSMQGYRLIDGEYRAIDAANGLLRSEMLGLSLERQGARLVFRDPATGREVLRPDQERLRQLQQIMETQSAKTAHLEAEVSLSKMEIENQRRELDRFRAEMEALRKQPPAN